MLSKVLILWALQLTNHGSPRTQKIKETQHKTRCQKRSLHRKPLRVYCHRMPYTYGLTADWHEQQTHRSNPNESWILTIPFSIHNLFFLQNGIKRLEDTQNFEASLCRSGRILKSKNDSSFWGETERSFTH